MLNVDVAPTLADVAGVDAPGAEGVSLMPLIAGSDPAGWRSDFLIEHRLGSNDIVPSYCAVRDEGHLYSQYVTGEQELYDLATDPFELVNVAGNSGYRSTLTTLRARLMELCDPLPPGFAAADVSVTDPAFSPNVKSIVAGQIVEWTFSGLNQHTVTDASGMGLFDSGPQEPGATFAVTFAGAGRYLYACAIHPTTTGTIRVPISISPATGSTTTPFTISWGAGASSLDYVWDVQIHRPASTKWQTWRPPQTDPAGVFISDAGIGTYSFRARLRNVVAGAASNWSLPTSVTIG